MKKQILLTFFIFLNLYAKAQETTVYIKEEALKPKFSNQPNNGVFLIVSTNLPGNEFTGKKGSNYSKWTASIILDGKTIETKKITPNDFFNNNGDNTYNGGNNNLKYTTLLNISSKNNVSGNTFYIKIQKEEITLLDDPFGDFDDPDGFNLSLTHRFYSTNRNITWTQPFVDSDNDGLSNHYDKCPNVTGLISNNGCPAHRPDSDNDGIDDNSDNCPNEAGPASNNGCPVAVTEAKLEFLDPDKSHFKSDCQVPGKGCVVGGNYIYTGNTKGMDFRILVKNNGNAKSERSYLHIYLRPTDGNDDDTVFYKLNNYYTIPVLNPGNLSTSYIYFNTSSGFFNGSDNLPIGNYNMQITIEESSTGKSTPIEEISIPFQVRFGDSPNAGGGTGPILVFLDMNGNEIQRAHINNKEDEIKMINKLSKGLYIINDDKGNSRKIYRK